MRHHSVAPVLAFAAAMVAAGPAAGGLLPGQSIPKKLYSNGDSITRAFDADFPADNLNVSWVNGYYGFWEQLLGLPNVKSHNQRITANWGSSGRANTIAAVNGARVDDLGTQAAGAAVQSRNVGYNTIIRRVTAELDAANPEFLFHADAYAYNFVENEISSIDCFHPSWRGQRTLSKQIWNQGPFKDFQGGS